MRNHVMAAAVMLAASIALPVSAQTAGSATSQIVTTGSGEARVTPDRATIQIGVRSRASTAAAAGSENARRQKAVIDTLRALGLAGDQISTANYSVWPETQPTSPTNPSPRVVAYNVSNTVRVEVRRIDDVGKLIDAALAKGANEISSLQFTSSKADSARRAALAMAVADARADAEALARAAGGSLGSLIELSSASTPVRPIMFDARMEMAAKAVPTPIEPGEQAISASVTARWAFVKQ
jgi:uncharacterized protein YggE